MPYDPAAVLRLFFAIPTSQISRDIEKGQFEPILEDPVAVRLKELDEDDPQVSALTHHRRMVWAKVLND